MKIVWDEPKRIANIANHGMDFADLDEAFFDAAIVRSSHSGRLRAIGITRHGVTAVVFALLGTEAVSVISMRPASRSERKLIDG
jgi:uncharacterized DUF497 family protein